MVGIDFWQFSPFEVHLRVFFQLIPEAWPSSVARFQQSCEFLLIFWAVCRVLCLRQMFVSFQTLQKSFSKNAFRYESHVYGFTAFHLKRRPRPVFFAHFIVHVGDFGCVSSQDFDTGWEYLYDGLVCPEAGALWNDFRIRVSTEGGIPQIWRASRVRIFQLEIPE